MITVLIVVGGFLIYLFLSTKNEEVSRVRGQGGLHNKYKELIDYFIGIPDMQVESKNNTSIVLAVKDPGVTTRFTVSHGFENVSIFWYHNSVIYGDHSLNWTFPENHPQNLMIRTIESELGNYERKLIENT